MTVQISLILPTLFFTLSFLGSDNVGLLCWNPTSHASHCSHPLMFLHPCFSKLLIENNMSRIFDLLISSLGKPCKSSHSRSGRCFLHAQTSVTGFTEDYAQDTPHITSSTVIYLHNAIMLSSSSARFLSPVASFRGCNHSVPAP
jgi:hypothetical protein